MKNFKVRIVSMLMIMVLCMNIALPNAALADEYSNTIYIRSAEDLIALAKKSSFDTWSRGKTVILTNDIDLSGIEFTPIPTFGGIFDGQGYTIRGLSLTDYNSPQGLFRYIQEGALVKNLTVKGTVTPEGEKITVGGVAGSNSGIILNCNFIGRIRGDKYVGGIAGINEAKGLISNSFVQGVIYGEHYVGGIAGENLGKILLSNNKAHINTIVTEHSLDLEDIQSIDIGHFISFSTEDVADVTDVGGIAGISSGIIQSCSNDGTVGYQHVGYNIGGIVGRQSGYLNGCSNRGIVYGRKDVGGIAGQIEPYTTWQLSENSLKKLRKELNTLQSMINTAINDGNYYSSEISAKLSRARSYATDLRNASDSLSDQTTSLLNDSIGSINDVSARITETLKDTEPIMDLTSTSVNDMAKAIGEYKTALRKLEKTADHVDKGMDTLYPALDKMEDALEDTDDAVNKLADALNSLVSSLGDSDAVEDALTDIQAGISDLIAAIKKIRDVGNNFISIADTLEKSKEWQENAPIIRDGAKELVAATSKMAEALQEMSNALIRPKDNFDEKKLLDALTALEIAVANFETAAKLSISGFSKLSSGLEKFIEAYKDNDEMQQAWRNIEEGLKKVEQALVENSDINYTDALNGLKMIRDSLDVLKQNTDSTEILNGVKEISQGIQALESTMKDLQKLKIDVDSEGFKKNLTDFVVATRNARNALLKINTALKNLLQSDELKKLGEAFITNLKQISDGVSKAIDALGKINDEAEKLLREIDFKDMNEGIKDLKSASRDLSRAITSMKKAVSYLSDAWPYFEDASDLVQKAISSANKATGTLKSSLDVLADAVSDIGDLVSDLAAKPKITFQQLDSKYIETKDEIFTALGNISDSLTSLNDTLVDTSDTLLAHMRAISDQMFVVFNVLVGIVEDVSDASADPDDHMEDISTQNTDSDMGGKVADSINYGMIEGDINVGGISGAMAIEYDFDLEDDHNLTEKMSGDSKFLLRAIISDCENYGKIASKKNHAGGIVGLMDFGYVVQSVDNGRISSMNGDYVGGIAGKSGGVIRKSYAKSSLSGSRYVGGIVGYGTDLFDCYSLIQVEDAHEYVGAIAGNAEGMVQRNGFVHAELAGINGISYAGKAEPISYEELLSVEGLPANFRSFRLTFISDGNKVAVVPFKYGETISKDKIPVVPPKEGYYGEWNMKDFTNLTFDATVEAVYIQYITTLASNQTRDGGPSVILVDGLFTANSSLTITESEEANSFKGEKVLEGWTVAVTDDGQTSHTIRYLAPNRQTSGMNIYLLKDGVWEKIEYTTRGKYILFNMEGTEATFIVTSSTHIAWIILLVILSLVLIIAVFWWIRRRRNVNPCVTH